MKHFNVGNRWTPPTPMTAEEIPVAAKRMPGRLLPHPASELLAAYAIREQRYGHQIAEAVTYGAPDVWERLMPPEATIAEMVQEYWTAPAMRAN